MSNSALPDFPYNSVTVFFEGYSVQRAENFRRTTLEDGAVAQRRVTSSRSRTISANIAVQRSSLRNVQDWMASTGRSWFNFRDPGTGAWLEVRLTEQPSFEYAQDRIYMNGVYRRYFRATLSLESNQIDPNP